MEQQSNLPALHSVSQLARRTNDRVSLIQMLLKEREAAYWYEKGIHHLDQSEWEGAVFCFNKAIKREPKRGTYYILKALASLYLKNAPLVSESLYEGFKINGGFQVFIATIPIEKWELILSFLIESKNGGHSNVIQLLFGISICQIATNRLTECVSTVESLKYFLDGLNKEFHLLNGILLFYLKKYEQCIEEANKILMVDKSSASAFNLKGLGYHLLHHDFKAVENFTLAINSDPDFYQAYANRARCKSSSGRYKNEDIIEDCNKALSFNSGINDLYYIMAKAYVELGDDRMAVASINKPIEFDPYNYQPYYSRGHIHLILKQYESAIFYFTKSIELNPEHFESFTERANSHRWLNNNIDAINDLTKAIELKEDVRNIRTNLLYYSRGNVKAGINDLNGAIEDYTKAIQFEENRSFYLSRGVAKAKLNDFQGAIEDYSKAIDLKPNILPELKSDKIHITAILNRGISKEILKDYTGAIGDYEWVLKIDPDHSAAINGKSRIASSI